MLDKKGCTVPTQRFKKVIPTLRECGFYPVYTDVNDSYNPAYIDTDGCDIRFKEEGIVFWKQDNKKWIGSRYCYVDAERFFAYPVYENGVHCIDVTVNQKAVYAMCRRLEFLDKILLAEEKAAKEPPYWFIVTSYEDNPCTGNLFYTLNRRYFRRNSRKYKEHEQKFHQLINDKKITKEERI